MEQPAVQRVVARLWNLRRHPLLLVVLLVLGAGALWLVLRPYLAQRVLSFDLTLQDASPQWSVQWTDDRTGAVNGAWLDWGQLVGASETLEIRPSGCPHQAGQAFALFLYAVTPTRAWEAAPNLQAFIDHPLPDAVQGRWVWSPACAGIQYVDQEPGLLRLELPPGGVIVSAAKTAAGGVVEFRYGDCVLTEDLYAPTDAPFTAYLERAGVLTGQTLHIWRPLPNYPLRHVTLSWEDSPGASLTLADVRVHDTVCGWVVRSRTLRAMAERGAVAARHAGDTYTFRDLSASGAIQIAGVPPLGRTANAVGYLLMLGGLCGLVVLGGSLAWLLPRVARRLAPLASVSLGIVAAAYTGMASRLARFPRLPRCRVSFTSVAFAIVVAVHLGMAAWAPVLFAPDSIDYMRGAQGLIATGNLLHVPPSRVPGFMVLLAGLIPWFRDFGTALGWLHTVCGILGAWMVHAILQPFVRRPWPAVAMLAVGLNPVALVYTRLALTECMAAFMIVLASWLAVRLVRANTVRRWSWPPGLALAVLLGLVCAAGAYVRANLQVLIVFTALAVLLGCWRSGQRWKAAVQAVLVVAVGLAAIGPQIAWNQRRAGRAEFIVGRHYQRLNESYDLRRVIFDDNQTRAFDYERWRQIRTAHDTEGRYPIPALLHASKLLAAADAPEPCGRREQICRIAIDESQARQPLNTLKQMGTSLVTQLGLWTGFVQSRHENFFWSLPLRGVLTANTWEKTNFMFDLKAVGLPPDVEQEFAARLRYDISYIAGSVPAGMLDKLFRGYEAVLPGIAVLFLLGLGSAAWRGEYTLLNLGLIVLASTVALATLIISHIDRYSAPLQSLMIVLAVYAVDTLIPRRARVLRLIADR